MWLRHAVRQYGPLVVIMTGFLIACELTGRGLDWDGWTFISFLCFYFAAWTIGDVLDDIGKRVPSR